MKSKERRDKVKKREAELQLRCCQKRMWTKLRAKQSLPGDRSKKVEVFVSNSNDKLRRRLSPPLVKRQCEKLMR